MCPLLQARDVQFGYSPKTPVIRNVSLSLAPATVGAIIGANGCGKSTLIRLLAGILTPASGAIEFQGMTLGSIDTKALARSIAYVPQSTSNTFPFTALEVVLTGRSPYLHRFQFERPADILKARKALHSLGIELSFREASANWFRSPAHWRRSPPVFSWTSRRHHWT
jgi:iron complex transport system ATP-binding protein